MAKRVLHSTAYSKSGVNYSKLDRLKRAAQKAAYATGKNLKDTQYQEVADSRGESAYLIEHQDHYLAMVQEGLGTKSLVADSVRKYTHKTFYDAIAIDTVAMIINDLITVGARPLVIQQYLATGDESWLDDIERFSDLAAGWQWACDQVGASWGGGETPGLRDIIKPEAVDLGGSAMGIVQPKTQLLTADKIKDGDAIVGFASSGIHANGVSLARQLATTLPNGYRTLLSDGQTFGEALLKPTVLFSALIQSLLTAELDVHYCANITGHGWRKLMRPNKPFCYTITTIPPVPLVLQFLCDQLHLSLHDAYGTFNMGLGMCVYLPKENVARVLKLAQRQKIQAWELGVISSTKTKKVEIKPLKIQYEANDLQIR